MSVGTEHPFADDFFLARELKMLIFIDEAVGDKLILFKAELTLKRPMIVVEL